MFYFVFCHCGEISLVCFQWLGCVTAWWEGFSGVLSIDSFEIFLLPFVCHDFWVLGSCQWQKQTSCKRSRYCRFIEFRKELSLVSDFSFRYFFTIAKAAQVRVGKADCWTNGFSPPGKYVEIGLRFISRQLSKANWPELGHFSSVLIGEAEKVWFSFGLCSRLKSHNKNHKTSGRVDLNFTLPGDAVDPLNILGDLALQTPAQRGLRDRHVLQTNITPAELLPRQQPLSAGALLKRHRGERWTRLLVCWMWKRKGCVMVTHGYICTQTSGFNACDTHPWRQQAHATRVTFI